MASRTLIDTALKLYQSLGGNVSKVLGTRTNVNFLGKGKSSELMVDMDINTDALGVLPQSKAVEELDSAMGYLTSGKLNDIQANKLISNMTKMKEFYNPPAAPANITDMATGTRNLDKEGLMSLRMGDDLPPPGSRGGPEDIAAPIQSAEETIKNLAKSEGVDVGETILPTGAGLEAIKNVKGSNLIVDDIVDKIYLNAGVAPAAQPVVRGNARDFLNRIKDLSDEPGNTTLSDIMEVDDFKFMTEGGGGGMGDPLLLVQKYFGPKVASAVARLDGPTDVQLFAERLVSVKDSAGRSITDRRFNPETVDISDFEFADGGQVPAADSQLVKESEGIMGYRGKKLGGEGIFPNFLQHGYFMEPRYPRTLEETKKLDTVKDIFDADQPMTQDVIDLSEGFTLSPLTFLKRLIANMEIKNTRKTKKADGGRVPFFRGKLVGKALGLAKKAAQQGGKKMGYGDIRKYGLEAEDISLLFRNVAMDKSLVGKEKTLYMQRLNQVLKNPDDFPEGIKEIQQMLGIDPIGFKGGGLAEILEV